MKPYHNHLLYRWLASSSELSKSPMIDSIVGSIDSPCRVHQGGARVPDHVHYWHSICCSTPPPGLTPFGLLQINSDWLAGRLNRFVSSSTSRWGKDARIHRLWALDSLLYCCSSLQRKPHSNFSRSTLMDVLVGSIDSACRGHQDETRTMRYVHYWDMICCSTQPSGLTPFEHLQIDSDWLAGMLYRWSSSSTLSRWKGAGVRPRLTLDLLFFLLLILVLLILLLQVWPVSNFCRSALIDLLVCSIDSSHRVH